MLRKRTVVCFEHTRRIFTQISLSAPVKNANIVWQILRAQFTCKASEELKVECDEAH